MRKYKVLFSNFVHKDIFDNSTLPRRIFANLRLPLEDYCHGSSGYVFHLTKEDNQSTVQGLVTHVHPINSLLPRHGLEMLGSVKDTESSRP